jgi:4-hydroxy-3-methylbut-2-enyl diphosphate reductase
VAGTAAVERAWEVQSALVPVGSVEQVSALRVVDPRCVSYVLRPGVELRAALPVVAALRAAFPRLRGQHPDQWCYAATDAWEERAGVCRDSEVTFWLDHAGRPGQADELQGPVWQREALHRITAPAQLRRSWIGPAATVGFVVTDESSDDLLRELVGAIRGLGPVSVVRRRVSSELGVPVGGS